MFKKFIYLSFVFLSFICLFFSSNKKDVSDNNLYFPIHKKKYYISSYFGYRTLGYYHFHSGIDIPECEGTPIYAVSDGVVSFIGFNSSYGNCLIIKYNNGYKSLYGHISSNYIVKVGKTVKAGELVAYVGPKYLKGGKLNGFTTGQHLHFTMYYHDKLIDPLSIKFKK